MNPVGSLTDAQLVLNHLQGDGGAYDTLISRYDRLILR
jgi:hypothetical protein